MKNIYKPKCDSYEEYICSIEKISPTQTQYTYMGRCLGTRERDACLCRGNPANCDFYPEKRTQSTTVTGIPINREKLVDELPPEILDKLFNDFYLIPKEHSNE